MPQWRTQGSPLPIPLFHHKATFPTGFRVDQGSLLSVLSQTQMSQQACLCAHLFLKPVPFPQLPPTRVCREGKAERLSCCRLGPLLPPGMTRNQSTPSASSRLCPHTHTTIQKPSQICKGGRNSTSALNCRSLQPSKFMQKEVPHTLRAQWDSHHHSETLCHFNAAGQCLLAHPE